MKNLAPIELDQLLALAATMADERFLEWSQDPPVTLADDIEQCAIGISAAVLRHYGSMDDPDAVAAAGKVAKHFLDRLGALAVPFSTSGGSRA